MPRALYIARWSDWAEAGTYRKAGGECLRRQPLDYYIAPVRPGDARDRLRQRVGELTAMAAIGVFDLLCQLSAAQPVGRRGWLLNPLGRPLTPTTAAAAIGSSDIAQTVLLIDALIGEGWIIEADAAGNWSGEMLTVPVETQSVLSRDPVQTRLDSVSVLNTNTKLEREEEREREREREHEGPRRPVTNRAVADEPRRNPPKSSDPKEADAGAAQGKSTHGLILAALRSSNLGAACKLLISQLASTLGDASERDRAQWAGVFGALASLPHESRTPSQAVFEQRIGELLAKAEEIRLQAEIRKGGSDPIDNPKAVFTAWLKKQGWLLQRKRGR